MPKIKRITKKAKKQMEKATLHLHDEIPKIGSGVRHVLIRKETPTYVWLLYGELRVRVTRKIFEEVRIK